MVKIGDKTIIQIYRGSELITDDSSNTKDIKLGNKPVNFVYQGNELLYPNPVKDGLVLWYDFKSMKNSDFSKNVARDLSGKGNNGTLKNFNYTQLSGYDNGLKYDCIDDNLTVDTPTSIRTIEMTLKFSANNTSDKILFHGNHLLDYFYISPSSHFVFRNRKKSTGTFQLKSITNKTENDFSKIRHVTLVQDNFKCAVYINGNSNGVISNYTEEAIDFKLVNIFNYNNSKSLDDKLHSIKVYDRILTDEEIQHNYQLEKERWGL